MALLLRTNPFNHVGFIFKVLAVFHVCTSISFANTEFENLAGADKNSTIRTQHGFLPGENIDLRTGSLNWRVKELSLPGDGGLDIDVYRSYNAGDGHPFTFGNWEIDIPRIVITTDPGGLTRGTLYAYGICKSPEPAIDFYITPSLDMTTSLHNYAGVKLIMPGQNMRDFYINHDLAGQFHISDAPGFPLGNLNPLDQFDIGASNGAQWVTTDGWLAECIQTSNNRYDGFKVTSPNGITYTFDKVSYHQGDPFTLSRSGTNVIFPSKAEDRFGNKIFYDYHNEFTCNSPIKLWLANYSLACPLYRRQIKAMYGVSKDGSPDGRLVTFIYNEGPFDYNYTPEKMLLREMRSGGKVWKFFYSDKPENIDNPEDILQWVITLDRVERPDGSEYRYEYEGQEGGYLGLNLTDDTELLKHKSLSKVILPEGGSVAYSYVELNAQDHFGLIGPVKHYALNQRTVSGPSISTDTFSFKYSTYTNDDDSNGAGGETNVTELHFPDSSAAVYEFGKKAIPGERPQGILFKSRFYNTASGNYNHQTGAFSGNSNLVRTETYKWSHDVIVGTNRVLMNGNRFGYQSRLVEKNLNGLVTTYSDFNDYGAPQKVVEVGTETREILNTYYIDTNHWILNHPENNTIRDIAYGDSTVTRGYFATGLLDYLVDNGVRTEYEYYSDGNLQVKEWNRDQGEQAKHKVEYLNYKYGVPQLEKHPESVSIERKINNTGTVKWEKDARGRTTHFEYDPLNRLKKVMPQDGVITDISYTYLKSNGNVTDVVKKEITGNYQKETYLDGFGRPYKIVEQDLAPVSSDVRTIYTYLEYDHLGRTTFESFPTYETSLDKTKVKGIERTYDITGRILSSKNTGNNLATSYCYDSDCNDGSLDYGYTETNARNIKTKFHTRVFGDPAKGDIEKIEVQKNPGSGTYVSTVITRDKSGHIWKIQQGGVTRDFSYNANKQLKWAKHPEINENGGQSGVQTVRFTYDLQGNLKTKKVNNHTTTYTYDDLNRLDYVDYPSGTSDLDYFYYPDGSLSALVVVGESQWDYQYNSLNQLTQEKLSIDGNTFTIDYGYKTNNGKLTNILESITYPNGNNIFLNPDSFGNAHQLGSHVSSASYFPDGKAETISTGSGTEITRSRYESNLTNEIEAYTKHGAIAAHLKYFYDSAYNIEDIHDLQNSLNNKSLSYDGLNRLTGANSRWGSGSFSYDDANNIKSMQLGSQSTSYNYNASKNRLHSLNGSSAYAYNNYGVITFNGRNYFDFDHANRLLKIKDTPSGNSNDIQYKYDGHGHRVKTIKDGDTHYSAFSQSGKLFYKKNQSTGEYSNYLYFDGSLLARVDECGTLDSDGDGIQDCIEVQVGLNKNDSSDAYSDLDGDGWSNIQEAQFGTSIITADTDGDGMDDRYEVSFGLNPFYHDSQLDFDNDGLSNLEESSLGTNPFSMDTDGDGIPDQVDDLPNFNVAIVPIIFYMND